MTTRLLFPILIPVLLTGCYDGHRGNPFDPRLTPSVELLDVWVDEGEGTATLRWTRYEGDMGFEAYRVERRVAERVKVDTVQVISSASDTSWMDEEIAPETEYVYRVIVRNVEGFEQESNAYQIDSFSVRPVRLLRVKMNAQKGEARLTWSRYEGPGFEEYMIERLDDRLMWEVKGTIRSVKDTTYTDGDLLPEVTYVYRVVVRVSGQDLRSAEMSRSYRLPSVELEDLVFDSRTATASLSWSRYDGMGFEAYEVWRGTERLRDRLVFRTEEVEETAFVDEGLDGNTVYSYRVVVAHRTGARSQNGERSGGFHLFIEEYLLREARYPLAIVIQDDRVYVLEMSSDPQYWAYPHHDYYVAQYDLSLVREWQQPIGAGARDLERDLAVDRNGDVYVAAEQAYADSLTKVNVIRVSKAGRREGFWPMEMRRPELEWIDVPRLAGIGVLGEDNLVVTSSIGDFFIFDSDGEEVASPTLYDGVDIAALEIEGDILSIFQPSRGQIWSRGLVESGGTYRIDWSSSRRIGEGIGTGKGQLLSPTHMVHADSDRLLVVNAGTRRIEVFRDGEYLTRFAGDVEAGPREFFFSDGEVFHGDVALDRAGNVYVADTGNRRVQKFSP